MAGKQKSRKPIIAVRGASLRLHPAAANMLMSSLVFLVYG